MTLLKKPAIALAMLLLLASPAMAQDLSGLWYGEGYQARRYLHWNSERLPDGRFSVEFRRYEDCVLVERWTESGYWALSGNRYRTIITRVADQPISRTEEYLLESYGMNLMQYLHLRTGIRFTAVKLNGAAHWPECDKGKLTS